MVTAIHWPWSFPPVDNALIAPAPQKQQNRTGRKKLGQKSKLKLKLDVEVEVAVGFAVAVAVCNSQTLIVAICRRSETADTGRRETGRAGAREMERWRASPRTQRSMAIKQRLGTLLPVGLLHSFSAFPVCLFGYFISSIGRAVLAALWLCHTPSCRVSEAVSISIYGLHCHCWQSLRR